MHQHDEKAHFQSCVCTKHLVTMREGEAPLWGHMQLFGFWVTMMCLSRFGVAWSFCLWPWWWGGHATTPQATVEVPPLSGSSLPGRCAPSGAQIMPVQQPWSHQSVVMWSCHNSLEISPPKVGTGLSPASCATQGIHKWLFSRKPPNVQRTYARGFQINFDSTDEAAIRKSCRDWSGLLTRSTVEAARKFSYFCRLVVWSIHKRFVTSVHNGNLCCTTSRTPEGIPSKRNIH